MTNTFGGKNIESINWTYQIFNWSVSIVITPIIAYLFTKAQMKNQYQNEIRKLGKQHQNEIEQLEQTYINNRKSTINDLQIQQLRELYDLLSKSVTTITYIWTAHNSYFEKLLNDSIEATDETWYEHNMSILENEKSKVNYVPQIRSKLLLMPDFKKSFTDETINIDGNHVNYIKFDHYIKYNEPKKMFEDKKIDNFNKADLDNYNAYVQRYFSLVDTLAKMLEKEIERIIKNQD